MAIASSANALAVRALESADPWLRVRRQSPEIGRFVFFRPNVFVTEIVQAPVEHAFRDTVTLECVCGLGSALEAAIMQVSRDNQVRERS